MGTTDGGEIEVASAAVVAAIQKDAPLPGLGLYHVVDSGVVGGGHCQEGALQIPRLIGLGNVDNTADLEKPVSNAMQAALDQKADESKLQGVVLGQIPDGSLTADKFAPGVLSGGFILLNTSLPVDERQNNTLYGLILVDYTGGEE